MIISRDATVTQQIAETPNTLQYGGRTAALPWPQNPWLPKYILNLNALLT
jgi:hypothetical protein